ncbi:hypothetical protein V1477_008767, partial [Vespula maculifrons]
LFTCCKHKERKKKGGSEKKKKTAALEAAMVKLRGLSEKPIVRETCHKRANEAATSSSSLKRKVRARSNRFWFRDDKPFAFLHGRRSLHITYIPVFCVARRFELLSLKFGASTIPVLALSDVSRGAINSLVGLYVPLR